MPFVFASLYVFNASLGHAYTFQMNSNNGQPYSWGQPVKPTFIANPTNLSGLSAAQVFTAFTNSLQRWKYSGSANIDFIFSQSAGNSANANIDGVNRVFFTSQTSAGFKLGSGTLGVTSSVFTGSNIIEADIWFNDESFNFTANPTDSTAFNAPNVFLESVATHEFGHAFGLAHSGVLQSAMTFEESRGQAYPSCDDVEGLSVLYPASSFTTGRGSITGVIKNGVANLSGGHVLAISKTRGTVVSGALSDVVTGAFTLSNLEPGDYFLMVEPFQTSSAIASLCGSNPSCYWANITSVNACAGSTPFKRMFVESAAGLPTKFTVTTGGSVSAGTISVGCTAMTHPFAGTSAIGTAPTITAASNNAGAEVGTAVRGVIGAVGTYHYYKLAQVQGKVSVKVLSFNLYSNFDPIVSIVDSNGAVASGASSSSNIFTSRSGFVNYDSQAGVTNNGAAADYYIKIENHQVASDGNASYPSSTTGQIDSTSFYLVLVTINDSTGLLPTTASPTLANNARCEQSADTFPTLTNAVVNTPTSSASSGGGAGGSIAGGAVKACGSIMNVDDDGSAGPPAMKNMVFSLWGFMIMLVAGRFLQQLASRGLER